jgi:hypothetical protein
MKILCFVICGQKYFREKNSSTFETGFGKVTGHRHFFPKRITGHPVFFQSAHMQIYIIRSGEFIS